MTKKKLNRIVIEKDGWVYIEKINDVDGKLMVIGLGDLNVDVVIEDKRTAEGMKGKPEQIIKWAQGEIKEHEKLIKEASKRIKK